MIFSLYPKTLFSRLVLLLVSGLLIAEGVTALVLNNDRVEMIKRTAGLHSAQRIAGIVKVLDQMPPEQRMEIAKALDTQGMRIDLTPASWETNNKKLSQENAVFLSALRFYLDDERPINFQYVEENPQMAYTSPNHPGMGRGHDMRQIMQRHMAENGLFLPPEGRHLIQVLLNDGQWVSFGEQLPQKMSAWPLRMVIALSMVLLILGLVALVAVKIIIKPLSHLAESARALGEDLQRPLLDVEGPEEVRDTLQAFNSMHQQIKQYVDERSRFLAAISHDLKTPLTRLRLRSGLFEDDEMRRKVEHDLSEMEDLIHSTLDFMRNEAPKELKQAVDINDLLETIQIDGESVGSTITLTGRADNYFYCHPVSMRRLINNLVENAIKYGGQANIEVLDSPQQLKIKISDEGTGIPEHELKHILEPFYRVEDSRSKETGGSGLGLSIANSIAKAHKGSLTLKNRDKGGIEAEITLPRAT